MKHIAVLGSLATLVKGDCETIEGVQQVGAPAFICNQLDNTLQRDYQLKCKKWKTSDGPKPDCCSSCQSNFKSCYDNCKDQFDLTPTELDSFSCDPLDLEHGNIYCTRGHATGTICIGLCPQGFNLTPRIKKRCKPRPNWNKNVPGKPPVRWNQWEKSWTCEKEYVQSPCSTNNGGCSHECLDRGDGNHKCICPCGQILGSDGKTCSINVFELTIKTSNTCDNEEFRIDQLNDVGTIVRFFNQELTTNNGRLGLGFWNNEKVNQMVTRLSDNKKMEKIIEGLVETYSELKCEAPKMGSELFEAVQFQNNNRDEGQDVSSVTFVTMAGAVSDDDAVLLAGRPKSDNIIVLANKDVTGDAFQTQTRLIGCGSATEECDNVLKITETSSVDIEGLVSRNDCYNRVYSSSISCTEFNMELRVPRCALKGLELSDVKFNDDVNCNVETSEEGTHFSWTIDYNDCGTTKSKTETGIISYANRLMTKVDLTGSVEPIMPIFDVPIQCDMHTSYDFVFEGAWHPDVSSFTADVSAHYELTGQMQLYHDEAFAQAFEDDTKIPNGLKIYVQSELDIPDEYTGSQIRINSCVSSPGELENMEPVETNNPKWMLINDGCINDSTVTIMERGPNGEIRFSFEGFTFHNFDDQEIQIQCQFKTCLEGDNCSDELPMCSNRRRR